MPGGQTTLATNVIAGYELLEKLGAGGVGVVTRAIHLATGRHVALKTVRAVREGHLAAMRREIQALSRVRHPGVVQILDVGISDEGLPWYAMELLPGRPLSLWLRGGSTLLTAESTQTSGALGDGSSDPPAPTVARPRPPGGNKGTTEQLLSIVCKLCTPLAYLHGQGIVHRDLKPSNVIVSPAGTPVLLDFGLVWPMDRGGEQTLEAQLVRGGTAGYMAPEQIRGELVDARADLYSLGCILYQVVTGRPPFEGSQEEVIEQHLYGSAPFPSAFDPDVEPDLEHLILSMLEKQPSRRTGYAADVAAALVRMGAEPWVEPKPPTPRPYVYRSPLVGRDAHLKQMIQHLEEAKKGRATLILVGGSSGIGKTTFSAATARIARSRGFAVIAGECHPVGLDGAAVGGPASLRAFSPFLRVVVDRCLARGPEEAARLLGEQAGVLAACEPGIAKVFESAPPPPSALPGPAARRRMLDALGATLGVYVDQRPLLLVIDDLQWADELSCAFLADLPPDLLNRPLVILGTYRTEQASAVAPVLSTPGVVKLELDELGRPGLTAAVRAMLGVETVDDPVVEVVTERSSGNPFFAGEYLRAVIEEGSLIRTAGRWELARNARAFGDIPLPNALNELLVRRLENLPGLGAVVAGLAAIVGREVTLDVLLTVSGGLSPALREEQVLDAVSELKARQILEEAQPQVLRFVHDKLRETSYDRTPSEQRTLIHLQVGKVLEEHLSAESKRGASAATLAHHFERGADPGRAIVYLDRAAEHARRSFSNADVIALLHSAMRLADAGAPVDTVIRARWHRLLGEAYSGQGDHRRSLEELHRSVSLLGMAVPKSTAGVVAALLAQVGEQTLHRLAPRFFVAQSPRSSAVLAEAARAYDLLMPVTYYVSGNLPRILLASVRNLNIAERLGPSPELALAYGNAQATAGLVPWHALAGTYERAGRQVTRSIDDEIARTWVLVMNSVYQLGVARWEVAREQAREAREISARLKFHRRWEEATGVLATIEFLSGQTAQALSLYEEQMGSAQRGDEQTRIWAAAGMAQALIRLGRADEACARGEDAVRLLAKQGRPENIFARGVLALAQWSAGRRPEALATAGEALAAIESGQPISFYCVNAYACVAQTFVEAAEAGESGAHARAERACRQTAKSARVFPASGPARDLWTARLAAAVGRPTRAEALYRRCQSLATSLEMTYELESARSRRGSIGEPASGPP